MSENILNVMMAIAAVMIIAGVAWGVVVIPVPIPLKLIVTGILLAWATSILSEIY